MAPRTTSRPPLTARIAARLRNRSASVVAPLRWHGRGRGRPHGLACPVVVTLTSHAPRFGGLLFTLRSLLAQQVRADRTILWVGSEARPFLPAGIAGLPGLEIRETLDIGPYTKLIPALDLCPDACLVTADDDTYYRPTWLGDLVQAWDGTSRHIPCHRAHRILQGPDGLPLPYSRWDAEIDGPAAGDDIFATGVGGVLYPPGALPPEARDVALFRRLAPRTDDLWLHVVGRMAGARVEKIGRYQPLLTKPSTQAAALAHANVDGGENDASLKRLIAHFGWPPVLPNRAGADGAVFAEADAVPAGHRP